MKLRNKKTGEIVEATDFNIISDYNSLAELNEEWEDYEEPKDYYFIRSESLTIGYSPISNTRSCRNRKAIGNYFETKEEAEKAVEKLKAFKILKDNGFKFNAWYGGSKVISFSIPQEIIGKSTAKDLNLLFGGEE